MNTLTRGGGVCLSWDRGAGRPREAGPHAPGLLPQHQEDVSLVTTAPTLWRVPDGGLDSSLLPLASSSGQRPKETGHLRSPGWHGLPLSSCQAQRVGLAREPGCTASLPAFNDQVNSPGTMSQPLGTAFPVCLALAFGRPVCRVLWPVPSSSSEARPSRQRPLRSPGLVTTQAALELGRSSSNPGSA